MKKISLFIHIAALLSGIPAFAISGGPFDNGSYSVLLERSGVYEASYSFKNGSGYSQWTADNTQGAISQGAQITENVGAGSLITEFGSSNNANRTVLYFMGVTYFGTAFGQVDVEARTIQGFGNANSDYSTVSTQTQQNNGFFSVTTSSSFSSNTVVSSGRSYTANVNWTGKITKTYPQLRFSGSGEIAIIAPNGAEAVASLAYTGYSQLIDAIAQSVGQSGGPNTNPDYTGAAAAISSVLSGTAGTPASTTITPTYAQAIGAPTVVGTQIVQTAIDVNGDGIFNNDLIVSGQAVANRAEVPGTPSLSSYLEGTGPANSYKESLVQKINVTGYLRYF